MHTLNVVNNPKLKHKPVDYYFDLLAEKVILKAMLTPVRQEYIWERERKGNKINIKSIRTR